MSTGRWLIVACCAVAWIAAPAAAQSSADYRIEQQVFNNGSGMNGASPPASIGFRIAQDAIGDMAGMSQASSLGFHLQGSFVAIYRPPGEVLGLGFLNQTTIVWLPETSVGDYALYRGDISPMDLAQAGLCLASNITETLIYEPFDPAPGQAWFYLATARNRLSEEGTKGFRSNGVERPNNGPCF